MKTRYKDFRNYIVEKYFNSDKYYEVPGMTLTADHHDYWYDKESYKLSRVIKGTVDAGLIKPLYENTGLGYEIYSALGMSLTSSNLQ